MALSHGDGPPTRYTLRRNTVSIMKIWIFFLTLRFDGGLQHIGLKTRVVFNK